MKPTANALRISVAGLFMGLTLLSAYLPTIPGSAFKFAGFPLLLGGLLVGPRTGFAIGCLTDLVNFALHPAGMFFPGFTLTQGLTGMLPGLLTWRRDPLTGRRIWARDNYALPLVKARFVWSFFRLLVVFGLVKTLTSVFMVSYFKSKLVAGTPLWFEIWHRAAIQAVHVPIYTLLAVWILERLSQGELYERILRARR